MNALPIAKNIFAFFMVGLLVTLAKEETKTTIDQPTKLPSSIAVDKLFKTKASLKGSSDDKCFDVNYPVQILLPNKTTKSVSSEKALDQFLVNWFDQHPNADTEPTLSLIHI